MTKFITRKEVLKVLGIHYHTLYSLAKKEEIETIKIGSRTLYNLDKYLKMKGAQPEKINICYCRVSSSKQKEDLTRQINEMKLSHPNNIIISDIGSSLNFERKGLTHLIDLIVAGKVNELVIAYKDRLARIGYELIEYLLVKYSNGKIIILNGSEEATPEEEMTGDIITIMNVYVAKVNGLRRYKKDLVNEINKQKIVKNAKPQS